MHVLQKERSGRAFKEDKKVSSKEKVEIEQSKNHWGLRQD